MLAQHDTSRPIDGRVYYVLDGEELRPVYYSSRMRKYMPVAWTPLPGSQDAFIECNYFEVLYEGNRGLGKTDALLMDFARHVGAGFGGDWNGILFRRTYPELGDVIAKSQKWFSRIFGKGAKYNASDHSWRFADGETLKFRHMKKPDDYWSYHGHAYPWQGWEELCTWPNDECYKRMFSCARTTNPKVPIRIRSTANPYGCVPFGDVLTEDGWTPIRLVSVGQKVLSVDAYGNMCRKPVKAVIEKFWEGKMVTRNGRGLSMTFTEDHRLPHLDTDRFKHSVKSFGDLPKQAIIRRTGDKIQEEGPAEFQVEGSWTYSREPRSRVDSLSPENFGKLYGWMISEGCTCLREAAFCIAQTKPTHVEKIHELLKSCGFHYRYDGQQFWVYEGRWADEFSRLGLCRDKHIPDRVKHGGTKVLETVMETLLFGDGSGDTAYFTSSQRLAEDVAEVGTLLGRSVYVSWRQRENRDGPAWCVNLSRRDTVQLIKDWDSANCELTPFSGTVYCLSVPETETFFIRQNGCVWLSGNSGHNWVKSRWNLPVFPNRLYGEVQRIQLEGSSETIERVAVHGQLAENKLLLHADPNYVGRLREAARNEQELRAWLYGDWNIVAGGMFDDVWNPEIHIIPDFDLSRIPKGWMLDRSYDHGQSKPFSVGWWAESNGEPIEVEGRWIGKVKGDLIRIGEWYGWNGKPNEGIRMTSPEIARGVLERENQMGIHPRVRPGAADSSIFDKYEGSKSVAGDMRRLGVRWEPIDKGPGSRKHGWEQMRKMLHAAIPIEGVREEAGLFILESCKQFERTIPVLPRSDRDLDDVDTEAEDHVGDEVRYRLRIKRRASKIFGWK